MPSLRFIQNNLTAAFSLAMLSSFTPTASAALSIPAVTLDALACSIIPSTIPQGAPGGQGSILAGAFEVHGKLIATPIPPISGQTARRYEYQYIVQNAFLPLGRPAVASNGTTTSYTGKVQVDTYHFPWKPAYYTAFQKVADPLSSMQLDEPFYAEKIIGGGTVNATYIGPAFTVVVKGALANGEMRNVAICTLMPSAPAAMIF